jgi:hypothetical protein
VDDQARFDQGLEAYRKGRFYDAHEHWEAVWRTERNPGRRKLLQALIQFAGALHKLHSGIRPRGASALLDRAEGKLGPSAEACFGVDPEALRAAIGAVRKQAAEALQKGHATWRALEVPRIVSR